jgi:hypothetical protein
MTTHLKASLLSNMYGLSVLFPNLNNPLGIGPDTGLSLRLISFESEIGVSSLYIFLVKQIGFIQF